ncbi:NAD(P)-binding domain-containing protein [Halalkalibacterium halodurans]|uniref:NAD(P)-binding domain-containing protein n=1 Tax=Halalkalibacterium halodurans TaxID=86665 RepID=UPI002AAA2686|nr:NAD(P)-binding domain-containing protein [Halalkalibacterium halodurans]MDY7223540.1 NAD(P)-binding domain-containing protein [Halalkalibacterium halodurans]MDY7242761.1 NAD(P)-binding domain-containing protein [Halalkalibacterium halodurans]MED4082811.1 NAD(P)-binding domain-containing protein [Halalkalibacterium halodurans]MED4085970.1 NAD(P)-binding domain-containing protein [Halalkalibacterium halodurans]MED4103146.1 NAD(P)-binding domain-containing protein [Halalkalibacterium haloduran
MNSLPVAIIGGGPVGLAAAAHLAVRDVPFVLFEGKSEVGASILEWKHVSLFSPWKYNIDRAAKSLLEKESWKEPAGDHLPTGEQLVQDYLQPLAETKALKPYIYTNAPVQSIYRKGIDKIKDHNRENTPFIIRYKQDNDQKTLRARAVIDATGTWFSPNPIGAGGVPAIGEEEAKDSIYYGIPDVKGKDRSRYEGKTILVVGSGHSAIHTLLDLAQLKEAAPSTRILWAIRRNSPNGLFGGGQEDALPARGQLGLALEALLSKQKVELISSFEMEQIDRVEGRLSVVGVQNESPISLPLVDEIVANTGARPTVDYHRDIRYQLDSKLESVPALAPLIDPNIHSCGTVRPHGEKELRQPEKNFYIAGVKSYGRAPTFLLATGYEQVRSIVASLAGSKKEAERVELQLPKTGVCKSDFLAKRSCC